MASKTERTGVDATTEQAVALPVTQQREFWVLMGYAVVLGVFGAVVSLTAVLLVFQYGQPRIFFAMARDGLLPGWASKVHPRYRTPHITTVVTGVLVGVAALYFDENEIYDLTNIGTLAAFAIVCIGVLTLRYVDPQRRRPFRVRALPVVAILGAVACLYTMKGLPVAAWKRFAAWLVIGLVIYFFYSVRHSKLRSGIDAGPTEDIPPPIIKT